jgi:ATP-dependent protease Clp ATPase subunit
VCGVPWFTVNDYFTIPACADEYLILQIQGAVGGAFTVEKIISARSRSSSIGFGAKIIAPEDRGTGEIFRAVAPEDLLKYGLIPEFVVAAARAGHPRGS